MERIYLDHAATTPLIPEAVKVMHQWNQRFLGNPSSVHYFGQKARARLEACRDVLANFLGIPAKHLFFTSGATEANNWILKSFAHQFKEKHILISSLEHPSVFNTGLYLKSHGFSIDFIEPDANGQITVSQIERMVQKNTALISVMAVNNETGIINPLTEIGRFCKDQGIKFHCDAVQALGKIQLDLQALDVDFLSISAHKIHGPKGVGAVYLKEPALLEAFLHGGQQEAGKRAGTENMTGIIGFAEAIKWLQSMVSQIARVQELQNYFEAEIKKLYPQAVIIGQNVERSPFISQIAFIGKDNQNLMLLLDLNGLAVSVGSACSSGALKPSRILQNMNLPDDIVQSALRFSFSYLNQKAEIDTALDIMKDVLIDTGH